MATSLRPFIVEIGRVAALHSRPEAIAEGMSGKEVDDLESAGAIGRECEAFCAPPTVPADGPVRRANGGEHAAV